MSNKQSTTKAISVIEFVNKFCGFSDSYSTKNGKAFKAYGAQVTDSVIANLRKYTESNQEIELIHRNKSLGKFFIDTQAKGELWTNKKTSKQGVATSNNFSLVPVSMPITTEDQFDTLI